MTNNRTEYDVIIVGAGPAGATAAIALQKSGLKIALIDKEEFPRDKICGDAISGLVRTVLFRINPELEKQLQDLPSKTIFSQAVIFSPKNFKLTIHYRRSAFCIRRIDFDNWLFSIASNNVNTTVYKNNSVVNVTILDNITHVTLENGERLSAKIILGCDGAQSIIAKQLTHFKLDKKHFSGAVRGYYKNIKNMSNNSLEIYLIKGYLPGYFWIFPLSDNEANVGFGMMSDAIAENKIDLRKSLNLIINNTPILKDRFAGSVSLGKIQGFGLPLGSKECQISGDRFLLCGDAASLIDPISGEGIGTAMLSGHIAAEQVMKCFEANDFSSSFMKRYDSEIEDTVRSRFRKHYIFQRILGNREWLINILVRLCNIPRVNKMITDIIG